MEFTQGCGAVDTFLPNCSIECSGQPTGMSESPRHPSPFCSITVPKRGTIDVLRLMYGRVPCFRREEASLDNLCYGFEFWVVDG